MTWAAAAAGSAAITVAGLSFLSGKDKEEAEREAAEKTAELSREEIAESARQFDLTQALTREELAESGRQFGLTQDLTREQFGQGAAIGAEQALSKRQFGSGLLSPFTEAGQRATTQQEALLGLGTQAEREAALASFSDSPGQKFIRDRAQKNLLRSSAAIGGLGGGNVRSALVEQGAGFAAQDFDRSFTRLGTIAGRGLQAGQTLTAADLGVSETALGLNKVTPVNPAIEEEVVGRAAPL